jgi:uncharacterized GH25 family protein
MNKKLILIVALFVLSACPLSAHEMILKPSSPTAEKGSELAVELQSTHVFVVKEEVENVDTITAGIYSGGKLAASPITPNEPELRIDFSVKIQDDGSSLVIANKIGEIYSVTNEGSKIGSRKELEAQGLKVTRSRRTDKFAKAIVNASASDKNFAAEVGQELELIPVTNPADAKPGEYFKVKVLYKGQPTSLPVWATYDGFVTEYHDTYAYYTIADADGIANIKLERPGLWMIRAAMDDVPGVEGEYDARPLRSVLTFTVK